MISDTSITLEIASPYDLTPMWMQAYTLAKFYAKLTVRTSVSYLGKYDLNYIESYTHAMRV